MYGSRTNSHEVYHLMLSGNFYGLEIWHGIVRRLNFGPGIFEGIDFCPHSTIPVTWNPEYPAYKTGLIRKALPHLGSQRGGSLEPWSPEISAVEPAALSFYWLEPWSFFGCGVRSPKTFCAEPGAQHFQVCLCVLTGIKKQNLKRGQYIIQVYTVISVYNDMQQLI